MMGLTESNIDHGKRIAEIGYTVLVADLYDRGFSLASDEAFAMMTELKDTPEEINRLNIVLDILAGDKHVIREKVGVVGFCYGGHCALELARIGAEIKTSISVHGTLTTTRPIVKGRTSAKVVVLNGARDPFVSLLHVIEFFKEMVTAEANFEFVNYAEAVHSFTFPKADIPGKMFYHEDICNRAFKHIESTLHEALI